MRLKKLYSSREVAALTGLSARQLQWWDSRRLFSPAVASHKTEAGGYTERRYTPFDVLELQALGDLRRRGFSIPQLRHLLDTLRDVFSVRLYEAIGEGGPMTLFIGGDRIYARMQDGRLFNLEEPTQALLMVGDGPPLRPVTARERRRKPAATRLGTPSRGRLPDAE
jgi:DNA-binding transcriptional MerR regulator